MPEDTDTMLARHGVNLAEVDACPGASKIEKLAAWLGVDYREFMAYLKQRAADCPPNPAWDVNWHERDKWSPDKWKPNYDTD